MNRQLETHGGRIRPTIVAAEFGQQSQRRFPRHDSNRRDAFCTNFQLFLTTRLPHFKSPSSTINTMAAQPIDFQSQVHAKYWRVRTAIAQPILDTEHAAFNRKLLDNELVSPRTRRICSSANHNSVSHQLGPLCSLKGEPTSRSRCIL
jgi:hypothetical protein